MQGVPPQKDDDEQKGYGSNNVNIKSMVDL
jgi:hypothetical protein